MRLPVYPTPRRFPGVHDCTWAGDHGKCRSLECRHSLLTERPRIHDWDPEDFDELVAAMPSTCSLDLANLGGLLLDEVAFLVGLPRARVEQLLEFALRRLARDRDVRRAHWDSQ